MSNTIAHPGHARMTRGLTFLFAVAGGAAVANLYWAQPLLEIIARDLHASPATAAWLVTATQVGYAIGVLLIVPLGDRHDRHRLIPTMMLISAAALAACAAAPTMALLLLAIVGVGLSTVAGQIITPLAGDLATDADRGHIVGTVASGLITGILISRTVSGLVADVAGWRTVYLAAAVVVVVLAALLFRAIPSTPAKTSIPYPALIISVFAVVAKVSAVRWSLVLGATGFAVFSLFWTALTFLLSAPPFSYSPAVIGLFGLIGLAGAIAAQRSGRMHDRGWSVPATGIAWAAILAAFVLAALGGTSVVLLIAAIVLLDVAMQAHGILTQTRIFSISHQARSRLNTAYVTSNFIGGAIGSAMAGVLWNTGGWTAVTLAGIALSVFALVVWTIGRRGPLMITREAA
ncbi:MAG: major facilitator superfamily 1 [Micrococcaceae bacterium]|nr:major facilitator superfamily 1 [Micrococcaceae bacterium]